MKKYILIILCIVGMIYIQNGTPIPSNIIDAINMAIPKFATTLTSVNPALYPNTTIPEFWHTITSGQVVEYVAHKKVVLQPGFKVELGAQFKAYVEPCASCED